MDLGQQFVATFAGGWGKYKFIKDPQSLAVMAKWKLPLQTQEPLLQLSPVCGGQMGCLVDALPRTFLVACLAMLGNSLRKQLAFGLIQQTSASAFSSWSFSHFQNVGIKSFCVWDCGRGGGGCY